MLRVALLCGVLAVVPVAGAQLLVGNNDTTGGLDQAWDVDPSDGSAAALWQTGSAEVWGMAYDASTNTVYANQFTTLHSGPLGSGAPANDITITDASGAGMAMFGLAWANGGLYATKGIANEALYQIDTVTGLASVVLDFDDDTYDFGGLAYNSADGLFYGTNDDPDGLGMGLYSIDAFGGGAISLIASYPAGEDDIDGLAIGDGVAYLVEDESGMSIHPYDLVAGAYLPDIISPMTSNEIFSGAAWVPEPGSLALLAVSALFGLRRRC